MRILATGSSGLVGAALVGALEQARHDVVRLVRRPAQQGEASWDPEEGRVDAEGIEGCDAAFHLAGASLARRWTARQKSLILRSRARGTEVLCQALARLRRPPKVLVCASAVGIYGQRGAEPLDEQSPPGAGFLAEVCRAWEAAAEPARAAGIRVVHARMGLVLTPLGGALRKMLLPFRLGLGGRVGSGEQYWSWVSLLDAVAALQFSASTAACSGPVNVVAPRPVIQREFARSLAHVLARPAVVPLPGFVVRLVLGEQADELLLASTRALPRRLEQLGFTFRNPELEPALRELLRRPAASTR